VTVQCVRLGGGFGGKESQSHPLAAIAALGAVVTRRPVRVRLPRHLDVVMTGKRHPFHATWRVGFDDGGHLLALDATLTSDGGWSLDLSEPVLARAMCHIDNAYFVPCARVTGRIARTNKTSQTAFRGFGGPQGMLVIEDILGRCAPLLGVPADELRRLNLYRPGQRTPYGQVVRDAERLHELWSRVHGEADIATRRSEVARFNATHADRKRGLAVTPVKFGISFNFTPLNQAGALVNVYTDGSVLVNHGGVEMGQGLHTKVLQIAATALGIPLQRVRLAPTRTDKVPNTSATAASSGTDLNGAAVKVACERIRGRLAEVASERLGVAAHDVRFRDGRVLGLGSEVAPIPFDEVVGLAHRQRIPLSSTGFYRTEGLHWDAAHMRGEPFKYFAFGVAGAEVELDGRTGTHRVRRVDIVHDVGLSISPQIDLGQVEGAFAQGVGWLTLEDLRWATEEGPLRGRLLTDSASTYKLPSLDELPEVFNVALLDRAAEDGAVHGSKAVGEPPLMLAFSVREALRDAVAAFGPPGRSVVLAVPSTPEALYWAIAAGRAAGAEGGG
jgi:xanthine dehydrogenase large subunit